MPEKAKNMDDKKLGGVYALPEDFDGVFRFTNWTENEFKARWANTEYTFPPKAMTPMIIRGATPEEVQHIRKKFAKELGEREYYKSEHMKRLEAQSPVGQGQGLHAAPTYVEADLAPYIQKCLEPLPLAQAIVKSLPKADEGVFHKDEDGKPISEVLDHKSKKSFKATGSGEGVD